MKSALVVIVIALCVVINLATNRIERLQRDVTALQQENDELKRYCPPVIRRPMEGANGSN